MRDFKDISDLRPASRQTPTPVLWLMATIVLAGSAALVMSTPDPAGDMSRSAQIQGRYAAAPQSVHPQAKSKRVTPQAR